MHRCADAIPCVVPRLYQRHGLAVLHAVYRSYVTGSIHGWSRLHLTRVPSGCRLEERKLSSQSLSITVDF